MKKLELKHLDFANNGKVRLTRLPHWNFENVDLQCCELHFNHACNEPFLIFKGVTFGLDQIKVYKRPLSDLTKEIKHNGEKFVPINWLNENKSVTLIKGISGRNEPLVFNGHTSNIRFFEYCVVEKLFEWHFDVFNLIPQGLAIDINTIEK